MMADSDTLRQSLVASIERAVGRQLEANVRRAFLAVERHRFVPRYYVQQERQWMIRDAGPEVYENRFFFTRLSQRGKPNSSSSQPSLMAPMLEALEIHPGSRVLEIGTGTGYNAALLGAIVGNAGRVISVDIAADLVECAAVRLGDMPWVKTIVADGFEGYAPGAPYDRIIATGGAATIPRAWLSQLTVGGILIGSLAGSGTPTPLYRLVKQEDGGARGSLLSTPAFFMRLSTEHEPSVSTHDLTPCEAMPVIEQAHTRLDLPRLLKEPGFSLFVDLRFPGLESHLRSFGHGPPTQARSYGTSLLLPGRAMLTFFPRADENSSFDIEVRGQEDVWSQLRETYTQWERLGKPALDRYQLTVDPAACLTLHLSET